MKRFIPVILFLLFAVPSGLKAAEFRHINTSDGLSVNKINAITKDRRGYMWFGTPLGLNRYDGFRIRQLRFGSSGLPDNHIICMFTDAGGTIWLRTRAGWCFMNPIDESFTTDINPWLRERGIEGQIRDAKPDNIGNVWIVTDENLHFVPIKGGDVISAGLGKSIPRKTVSSLFVSETVIGVCFTDGTVVHISSSTLTVMETLTHLTKTDRTDNFHTFIDKSGMEIIYTGEYSCKYDPETGGWTDLGMMVTDVIEDHDGNIWIATVHNGVYVQHPGEKIWTNMVHSESSQRTLSENTICCLYSDDSGALWLGGYKTGVNYTFENDGTFSFYPIGDICTIIEDNQGKIWCGSNDSGIKIFNPTTGNVTDIPMSKSGLRSDIVVSSTKSPDGAIWLGTYGGGLCRYKDGRFTSWHESDGILQSEDVWALESTPDGKIVIGTLGRGVHILDPATGKYEIYDSSSGLADDHISSLCFGKNGILYVGLAEGLAAISLIDGTVRNLDSFPGGESLRGISVTQVFPDSRGLLWIASLSGLYALDPYRDKLYRVSARSNPTSFDTSAITEDSLGQIWVTTADMFIRVKVSIDYEGWSFSPTPYTEDEGVPPGFFNKKSILSLSNGDIIAGSLKGLVKLSPKNISESKDQAMVLFSGLLLPNGKQLPIMDRVELGWKDRSFTVQLASSDVGKPGRTRFLYRIEGLNDEWTLTSDGMPAVQFTHAHARKYTLEARVADQSGEPDGPLSRLIIRIWAPWYRTGLAGILFLLLFSGIVYLIYTAIIKRRMEKEQQRVEDMKQVFFTNISHELRSPLTLILSPIASLQKAETDPEKKNKLDIIDRNAHKLLEMVNEMLDLRRIMVNADKLHIIQSDIIAKIMEVTNQFQDFSEKSITTTFNSSVDSLIMNFDEDKIVKIVANLLSNAHKFTNPGGRIDVNIDIRGAGSAKDVVISVADNGIGISDEEKPHVFERFWQSAGSSKKGGSGIGLHIVQEYVHMHGGTIAISDNPGGGAVFTVVLPVNGEVSPQAAGIVKTSRIKPWTRANVMLVDDSEDFLDFLSAELSPDFNIITAHDGQDALDKFDNGLPDIVVTDVMMPVMDGNALCYKIKVDPKTGGIPVIMLTARLSEENEKESRQCGADDYFTKPFDIEVLKQHIYSLLGIDPQPKEADNGSTANAQAEETPVQDRQQDAGPAQKPVSDTGSKAVRHADSRAGDQSSNQADTGHQPAPEAATPQSSAEPWNDDTDDEFVSEVISHIEKRISDTDMSVESLADEMGMSRVSLYRRLVNAKGSTPNEFIRLIRLRKAEELLASGSNTVADVSSAVGFSSPSYFSKCFKDLFGYLPSEVKRD